MSNGKGSLELGAGAGAGGGVMMNAGGEGGFRGTAVMEARVMPLEGMETARASCFSRRLPAREGRSGTRTQKEGMLLSLFVLV